MSKKESRYFIINKPYKVLSQFSNEEGHLGLGAFFQLPKEVYPVGRLDLDSEGLLLLTNDKTVNNKLLDPKYGHQRIYRVEVEGLPNEDSLAEFRNGMEINLKGKVHRTKPCEISILDDMVIVEREPPVNRKKHPITSWVEVILTEGKNRQVRRMTAKMGHPTLRLIRYSIEALELGHLEPGQIVELSKKITYAKLRLPM